jgi:hypothetical protein
MDGPVTYSGGWSQLSINTVAGIWAPCRFFLLPPPQSQHGPVKMHQAECPLRPRRHLRRLFISWADFFCARCTVISGFKSTTTHQKWSMTSVHSTGSATFGQFLHYRQSQCMAYSLKMLAFGIILGEFPVLRSHLGGILRDWFSPSELSRANFLYFGIISAGFRENDSFTFGIISVGFHEIDFSPSESSRWDFARLIFSPSESFLWSFHLRNHLGRISRYEFFTFRSYLGS